MTKSNLQKNNFLLKKRRGFVLEIVLAAVMGLLVTIAGNIIYDLFFVKTIKFSDIDSSIVSLLLFAMIVVESFLEFLLRDVNNGEDFDKSFWKRFSHFSMQEHWLAVFSNKFERWVKIFLKWGFWLLFIVSALFSKSWIILFITLVITVIIQYRKYNNRKKDDKK